MAVRINCKCKDFAHSVLNFVQCNELFYGSGTDVRIKGKGKKEKKNFLIFLLVL